MGESETATKLVYTIMTRKDILERAYLISLALFIAEEVLRRSFFQDFKLVSTISQVILLASCALAVVKLVVDFFCRELSIKNTVSVLLLTFCCAFFAIQGKTGVFMFLVLFSAAGHNVSYEKILSVFAKALLFSVMLVVIGNGVGIIGNSTFEKVADGIKYDRLSCGFKYYYEASHYSLFLTLVWLYYRKNNIRWGELFGLLGLNVYIYAQALTRMPFLLSIVGIVVCALLKGISKLREYRKMYGIGALVCYPAMALTIICTTVFLNTETGIWSKMNRLTSGRLCYNDRIFNDYGIHLLGADIQWMTTGGYNYVDSSYMYYLFDYGVLFLMVVLTICVYIGWYSRKRKDTYFAFLTCIIAVYAIFDNWWLRPECNVFMFAFPYVNTVLREINTKKEISECEKSD